IHQTRRSLLTKLLKTTLQSPLPSRGNPRRHQPHRDILLQLAQLLLNFEDLSTRPLYHPRVLLHRERLDNIRPRQLPDEQRLYRLIQPVGTPRHMPHRRSLVHAVAPVPPPGRIIPRRSASSRPGHGSDITAAHVTDSDPCQQPPRRRIPNVPLPCRCGPLFSAVEPGLHLRPLLLRPDRLPLALGDCLALIGAYPLE